MIKAGQSAGFFCQLNYHKVPVQLYISLLSTSLFAQSDEKLKFEHQINLNITRMINLAITSHGAFETIQSTESEELLFERIQKNIIRNLDRNLDKPHSSHKAVGRLLAIRWHVVQQMVGQIQ